VNSDELNNAAADRWGNAGSNGGNVILTADNKHLAGSITADKLSSVDLTLKNGSTLKGAIDLTSTAKEVKLTLDSTSSWDVTANSYSTCLSDEGGISGEAITNIKGNGFPVYYKNSSCPALGEKTYTLVGI
jgi:hypothetical protein